MSSVQYSVFRIQKLLPAYAGMTPTRSMLGALK